MISDVYVARHYSWQSSSSISRSLRMWVESRLLTFAVVQTKFMRETTIFPICSESRLMSHDSFSTRSCCCWRNQVPRILNVSVKHSRLAESPARGKLNIPIQWKFIQDYSKHKCVISLFSINPHRTACGLWITNGASHWRWRRNKPAEDYRWGAEHSDKATYRLGSRNVLQQLGQKRSWVRFGIVVYELIIEFLVSLCAI